MPTPPFLTAPLETSDYVRRSTVVGDDRALAPPGKKREMVNLVKKTNRGRGKIRGHEKSSVFHSVIEDVC